MNASLQPRSVEAIFRPALTLMAGRALGFVVAFIVPMVLARLFTQEEFGTYKQLFLIFGTLMVMAQIGMAESLFYFLPSERRYGGSFVFNALVTLSVIALLCLGGMWLLRERIAAFMNNPALAGYLPYIGLYLAFMLVSVLLEIVMTVRRQHVAASCAYALSDVLRTALYLVPVLIFAELRWLLLGAVVFAVLRFAVTVAYLAREFGESLRPSRTLLRQHLGYAIPFGIAVLIEVAQGSFHMYAVSWYFDAATFAVYSVGCLQVPLFGFLTSSTANVLMTSMRESLQAGRKAMACAVWSDTVRKMALSMFPLVGVLLVTAYEFITLLFTEDYAGSVPIFMVWTASTLFGVLMTDSVLRVLAETRFLIVLNLLQLALIAATIHWFIGGFGLLGAVLVSLMSTTVRNLCALARIRSALDLRVAELLPWRALASCLLITLLAMLPALMVTMLLDGPVLMVLLCAGFAYAAAYLGLLLLWGPMHADEKQMFLHWLSAPVLRAFKFGQAP